MHACVSVLINLERTVQCIFPSGVGTTSLYSTHQHFLSVNEALPYDFSEAPHLRSSMPHPKTDFSEKIKKASRRIIPWPKSTKRFFFSNSRLTFRRFGVKEPRLSETKQRKCATSIIVERVDICYSADVDDDPRSQLKSRAHPTGDGGISPTAVAKRQKKKIVAFAYFSYRRKRRFASAEGVYFYRGKWW